MKACVLQFVLFLLPFTAEAAGERIHGTGATLSDQPTTPTGIVRQRSLASVVGEQNKAMFEAAKPGDKFIVQNSVYDMNDEVVTLLEKYEDHSFRLRRPNDRRVMVKPQNLKATLSPEVECGISHGTKICKGEMVFYPAPTTSLTLPEDEVKHIFDNRSVVVKDGGGQFVLDLDQVGTRVRCSPQKESICNGDFVHAEVFKAEEKFAFDGVVEQNYSNGISILRVGSLRYPVSTTALNKRVESLEANADSAILSNRGSRTKVIDNLSAPVTEELEPLPAPQGESFGTGRRSLSGE